jgi:hypothetical protein
MGLTAAIRTANAQDAAWLIQAAAPILSADAIWTAMEHIAQNIGRAFPVVLRTTATPHPVSQTQYQLTAAVTLMRPAADPLLRQCPFSWTEYDASLGRKSARRYSIPTMAIHADTTRGRLPATETNIETLRNPVPYLPEGCAYWCTVLQTTKGVKIKDGAVVFANAATKERFYAAHFPDDIPDEWSVADRQLSHGDGFVVPGTLPSRANWLRGWLPETAAAVASTPKEYSKIRQIIESSQLAGYYMDEWLAVSVSQFPKTL